MGKIGPKCKGCARLTNALDPLCISCVNQCNYEVRQHNFDIGREMDMLELPLIRLSTGRPNGMSFSAMISDDFVFMDEKGRIHNMGMPEIEKVIFNGPATVVYWKDGSKTIVKCENEIFDPEKGLAMAIAKKALGNKGDYYNVFKKWLPKSTEESILDKLNSLNARVNALIIGLNDDEESDDIHKPIETESEILPYGGNKNRCNNECSKCCPVLRNNKSYAAKVCKTECEHYKCLMG